MTEPELIHRQRAFLHDLVQLAAARAKAEADTLAAFAARNQAATQDFEQSRAEITSRFETDRSSIEGDYERLRHRVVARFDSEFKAAQREEENARDKAAGMYELEKDKARRELHEARWESAALSDAARNVAQAQFKEIKGRIDTGVERYRAVENEAIELLDEWKQSREFAPAIAREVSDNDVEDLEARFEGTRSLAESSLVSLRKLVVPKAFRGHRLRWAFAGFWGLAILSLIWTTERPFTLTTRNVILILLCVLGPVLVSLAVRAILASIAAAQVARVCQPMVQAVTDCEAISHRWLQTASADLERQKRQLQERQDGDTREAEARCNRAQAEAKVRRDAAMRQADQTYPTIL